MAAPEYQFSPQSNMKSHAWGCKATLVFKGVRGAAPSTRVAEACAASQKDAKAEAVRLALQQHLTGVEN